jgi:hypothetical protein
MAGEAVFLLTPPTRLHRSYIGGMATQAPDSVQRIRAWKRILMWIMAGDAGNLPTCPKAATDEQSDGRKPDRDRVFQLWLVAHVGVRQSVALSANLDLRFRGQPAGIRYLLYYCFMRSACFSRLDMRATRAMTTLALHTGGHPAQVWSTYASVYTGRVAVEASRNRQIVLQNAKLGGR